MNQIRFPIASLILAKDKKDLANYLDYDYKEFCNILYSKPIHTRYKKIEIPKKSGGKRIILSPDIHLKKLQRNLNINLSELYEHKNSGKQSFSFAFRKNNDEKKFGIYFNAKRHRNRKLVVNIDLKDFFHTIEFKRIVGYFKNNNYFKFPIEVAIGIAQIACYKDPLTGRTFLPQGSPVSPIISNLITEILDAKITKLAKKYKFYYSRYADDITLSFDTSNPPYEIIEIKDNDFILGSKIIESIKSSGFNINNKKICFRTNFDRQQVTGLVVNKKINVPRKYYNYSKSMAYEFCKTGTFEKSSYHTFSKNNSNESQSIIGIMNYIYNIKTEYANRTTNTKPSIYTEFKPEKPQTTEQIFWSKNSFKRLLLQTYFQAYFVYNQKVHIVCEGKTDPLHFKIFMSTLDENTQNKFKFSYFNEEKLTIFQKELNIRSGTTNLSRFIEVYSTLFITERTDIKPTIILVDNDDAGNKVFNSACGRYNKTSIRNKIIIDTKEIEYAFICKNLYLLKLPEVIKNTCIEDMYDPSILSITLKGKYFCKDNNYDPRIYYGKIDFINNVIKKNVNRIDYENFSILFKALERINTFNLYKIFFE